MQNTSDVNCKHYNGNGKCLIKPRRFFGLFKIPCQEVKGKVCSIKEPYTKITQNILTEDDLHVNSTIENEVKLMVPTPPSIAGRKETKIPHSDISYTIYSPRKTYRRR